MKSPHYRSWHPLLAPSDMVRGTLLVIAPHPDDEVIGPGGLVAAHRAAGERVVSVVLTDGVQGDAEGALPAADYVRARRDESLAASEKLGGGDHIFCEFPDGGLRESLRDDPSPLVEKLRELIRSEAPATITFPSPYEIHPDHRAASLALLQAVSDCGLSDTELLAFEVGAMMPANLLINITDFFSAKRDALAVFATQLEHQELLVQLDALNRSRSVNCDDPLVTHCEAFLAIDSSEIAGFVDEVERVLVRTDKMMPPIPPASSD